MLDAEGLIYEANSVRKLCICKICHSDVTSKGHIPCIGLVNDMYISPIPALLQDLTLSEECMVLRQCAKCYVIYLCGKPSTNEVSSLFTPSLPTDQRGLKGHIIIFLLHPENLV